MKFYLASSFDLVKYVKKLAETLKDTGQEITVEWWRKDYKTLPVPDDDWYENTEVRNISSRNFKGIRDADIFVLVAHPETPKKFNGANIELGYALALGKECFSIGKLQRSAMYVPVKKCKNVKDFLTKKRLQTLM